MLVQPISTNYNQNFGMKFTLSKETISAIEESTGLTYKEMTGLSFSEAAKTMKERGTLKPNKLKKWFSKMYINIGKKLGLLDKHNIY